jgi:hypothetical protein
MVGATQTQQNWMRELAERQQAEALALRTADTESTDDTGNTEEELDLDQEPSEGSSITTREQSSGADADTRTPADMATELEESKLQKRRARDKKDPLSTEQRQVFDATKKEGTRILRAYLNIGADGAGATLAGLVITALVWLTRALFTRFTFLRNSRAGSFLAFQGRGIKDLINYAEPTPKWGMIGAVLILILAGIVCLGIFLVVLWPIIAIAIQLEYAKNLPIVGDVMKLFSP